MRRRRQCAEGRRAAVRARRREGSLFIIVGVANLFADGLSMGVGNYLSIRARESALEHQQRPEEEARPVRHGVATLLAFVVAGTVPLLSYLGSAVDHRFLFVVICALGTQFGVGAARSFVTASRWWVSGLEMLVSAECASQPHA